MLKEEFFDGDEGELLVFVATIGKMSDVGKFVA
jgi:hypothetical protein